RERDADGRVAGEVGAAPQRVDAVGGEEAERHRDPDRVPQEREPRADEARGHDRERAYAHAAERGVRQTVAEEAEAPLNGEDPQQPRAHGDEHAGGERPLQARQREGLEERHGATVPSWARAASAAAPPPPSP